MKSIVNLYHRGTDNVGDDNCSPLDYFGITGEKDDLTSYSEYENADAVIFGGGMVLKKIRQLAMLEYIGGLKIGWGVGHNNAQKKKFEYADEPFLKSFDLLGVRDFVEGLRYVPCPSCMLPHFGKFYEIKHEVVFYQNTLSAPMKDVGPVMGNDEMDIGKVIEFLASGETVVASSYHGVYWAMLLGRKVIAVPFNAKFYGFRYDVPKCELGDWMKSLHKAQRYDGFLEVVAVNFISLARANNGRSRTNNNYPLSSNDVLKLRACHWLHLATSDIPSGTLRS